MGVHGAYENQWNRVRGTLRKEAGVGPFSSWLNSMRLLEGFDDRVELGVPSSLIQDKIERTYGTLLLSAWQRENPRIEAVDILIDAAKRDRRPASEQVNGARPVGPPRAGRVCRLGGIRNGGPLGGRTGAGDQTEAGPEDDPAPDGPGSGGPAAGGSAADARVPNDRLPDTPFPDTPFLEPRSATPDPGNPRMSADPLESEIPEDDLPEDEPPENLPESLLESDDEAGLKGHGRRLGFRLVPRFTFDRFVVGTSNEFAYAAARRVAERHTPTMNPLFIHGPPGLGKSHLLQAIGWHIQKTQPDRRVLFLNAEQFMYEFVRALRHEDTITFKERFRTVDVLLMDDIHFIGNKDRTQDEFFHTFNALVDQNRSIVVSADTDPSKLVGMAERLRSRLKCGLVADILPTTYEFRVSLLREKALEIDRRFRPSTQVLEFIAHKLPTNVRELEGALNRVAAHAELVSRSITIESVGELLQDLISQYERRLTIDEIQRVVAEHFNVRISDLHSPRRMRSITRPRQVAMALCKELTERSLPEIGKKFGGRDHTTVMHAAKKVEQLCAEDTAFREEVSLLRRKLGG